MDIDEKRRDFARDYFIVVDRFQKYISHPNGIDGCWLWTGGKTTQGYGSFYTDGDVHRTMTAHRIAYGLHHGVLPDFVTHRCPNKVCVNPKHLYGYSRSRHPDFDYPDKPKRNYPTGEKHHRAKLTEDKVRSMRRLYAMGGVTQATLSIVFNVGKMTVFNVLKRKSWKHVD